LTRHVLPKFNQYIPAASTPHPIDWRALDRHIGVDDLADFLFTSSDTIEADLFDDNISVLISLADNISAAQIHTTLRNTSTARLIERELARATPVRDSLMTWHPPPARDLL